VLKRKKAAAEKTNRPDPKKKNSWTGGERRHREGGKSGDVQSGRRVLARGKGEPSQKEEKCCVPGGFVNRREEKKEDKENRKAVSGV